jgi:hypothetical protein
LVELEDKLFEHSYAGETDNERLNRLEQFVFGDKQSGSPGERISHLESAVVESKPAASQPPAEAPTSQAGPSASSVNNNKAASYPKFDYASYPRVTAIEKQMLGATYEHEPLPVRVARLETKAFGKVSTSDDLGDRVDLLDQYAFKHDVFHENARGIPVASSPQFVDQAPDDSPVAPTHLNPFAPGNQVASGSAQRTTIMESAVFGRSFPNRPLEERVQRLEKKLIPYEHNLAKNNLPTRVDHLWSILSAANNLNSPSDATSNSVIGAKPLSQMSNPLNSQAAASSASADQTQLAQASGQRQSWLHKLGKFVASSQGTPQSNAWDQ